MANRIVVEIEALDYEITPRDVAEALKSHFPNMQTVVRQVASQQSFAPDVAICEDCGKSPAMEGCSVCAECGL